MAWKIAIYGTPIHETTDSDSCIALSELTTTNPMLDTKWLVLDIYGWEDSYKPLNDNDERIAGVVVHNGTQTREHTIKLYPFTFPEEKWKHILLAKMLRNKNIYLFKGDFGFVNTEDATQNYSPHPDGMCLKVAGGVSDEYDYDDGSFEITLTFRNILPYYMEVE